MRATRPVVQPRAGPGLADDDDGRVLWNRAGAVIGGFRGDAKLAQARPVTLGKLRPMARGRHCRRPTQTWGARHGKAMTGDGEGRKFHGGKKGRRFSVDV
jgi:hypothetical protein